MQPQHIRNFCIIAHIDHGKSTLADRLLELTGTVEKRKMKEQLLDQMDLERERGITIKLAPVRMNYVLRSTSYVLNLIDTPGHVDFTYEVSRSLAAVEGAILLVDATQGVQAQTIANLYLAIEQNLTIIPVINKIDLPNADIEKTTEEIMHLLGCAREDILRTSGKTGEGVPELLEAIIARIPPPHEATKQLSNLATKQSSGHAVNLSRLVAQSLSPLEAATPLRALIFDSFYDDYRGVVASVRILDGTLKKNDPILLMRTGAQASALEVGHYAPALTEDAELSVGQIGYVVTGMKELGQVRVGDTVTRAKNPAQEALPGYKEVKPMVFAGIFPKEGDAYRELRDGIEKLKLSDSALSFEPEHSAALGFGFRCGFLGMLHLDIFQERLRREFDVEIVATVPSVAYHIKKTNGDTLVVKSPQELPDPSYIADTQEPWMTLDIITPDEGIGNVMGLVSERKGRYLNTEYLSVGSGRRAILHYEIPLSSLITDFYDKLKTVTSGYASMNYEFTDYRQTDVVRLDILVAEEPVEALSTLVWREDAFHVGKKIVESLKETLPKQQFELKIQAAIGGKIIAAERLSALRKDVLAKLSGGDVTRKRKLLEKQKKGKKRRASHGRGSVDIPPEAYLAVLKR